MKLLLSVVTVFLLVLNLCSGQNLILNGDFALGNTNFSSEYVYHATPLGDDGTYTVTATPQAWNNFFYPIPDHTPGGGTMMLVANGATSPNLTLWRQTVPVAPFTSYIFRVWVSTAVAGGPAVLRLVINGSDVGNSFTAPSGQGTWSSFEQSWTSGSGGTATLEIIDLNVAVFPNDFYVDDISFSAGEFPIPPQLTSQPLGTVGYWGGNALFGVGANGTAPLSHQWYKESFPISWGTNSTLTLTNIDFTDAGNYSVTITNAYGSTNSAQALLVVNPSGVRLGIHPFLSITGTVGKAFGIQSTTEISQTNSWTTRTNFTLASPSQEWVDQSVDVTVSPRRFYRVVPLPNP